MTQAAHQHGTICTIPGIRFIRLRMFVVQQADKARAVCDRDEGGVVPHYVSASGPIGREHLIPFTNHGLASARGRAQHVAAGDARPDYLTKLLRTDYDNSHS